MAAVDVVKRLYQAYADDDSAAMLDTLDPEVEWTEAAGYIYSGTYHGPDAVVNDVLNRSRREWDGFSANPEVIISEGDQVVSRGWYSGTYRATNRSFRARFTHWYTVKDGKIVRFEQIVDTLKVQEAL